MNPRILRDFQRILALVKAVTVLRHNVREQDAEGRWIATLDDYEYVRTVLGESYAATVSDGLSEDVRAVVEAVSGLRQGGIISVSYLEVAKKLGWDRRRTSRKSIVALTHGWLVNKQDKPRQPVNLDVGDEMPEARGLPLLRSPRNACPRDHALNDKEFSVDTNVDTVGTVDNGVDTRVDIKTQRKQCVVTWTVFSRG